MERGSGVVARVISRSFRVTALLHSTVKYWRFLVTSNNNCILLDRLTCALGVRLESSFPSPLTKGRRTEHKMEREQQAVPNKKLLALAKQNTERARRSNQR